MKRFICSLALFGIMVCASARQAQAQATPFLGQIAFFAFNFCPAGWAAADGQIMSITQNTALFSLLGTNFGGNGTTNFALPSLAPFRTANGPLTVCIAITGVFPSRS